MTNTMVTRASDKTPRPQWRKDRVGTASHKRTLTTFLARRMKALAAVEGRTKRSAARLSLVAAMREGLWPAGARLPSEKELVDILGVSLGTVQAALRQLQQTGMIVRRRGDGTRVASIEPLSSSIWHFRFKSRETGHPLRFVSQEVEVAEVETAGPWSEFLTSATRFIRIRRRMTMSDKSRIFAEMYLDAESAKGLADLDAEELDTVNIRPYLEETYGIATASARHSISTRMLMPSEASVFGLAAEKLHFEIHAKAFDAAGRSVYFQRILVDCTDYVLDF
jgi:GntR family transcriptional regulator